MKHKLSFLPVTFGLLVMLSHPAHSKADSHSLDLAALVTHESGTRVHNRAVETITDGERAAVHCDARGGDGLGWFAEETFSNGVIDCDIKGRNAPGRSFVGIAFHGVDETTFEAIYFRPFNFISGDPARRAHSVQYISMPDHDWSQLRRDHPGVYESEINPAPKPDEWLHARIVVEAKRVSVFVNDATAPCLVVDRIPDRKSGWIGIWVGNGSEGMFANLKVRHANEGASD